jgi:hypothetical protein
MSLLAKAQDLGIFTDNLTPTQYRVYKSENKLIITGGFTREYQLASANLYIEPNHYGSSAEILGEDSILTKDYTSDGFMFDIRSLIKIKACQ